MKKANSMIAAPLRDGRILDIGCGEYPYFLLNTEFRERYGIDKTVHAGRIERYAHENIVLAPYDAESEDVLPFPESQFDVVTMLAVLEHIEPARAERLVADVRRVLKPGGMYILTTPAAWSDWILRVLARSRLVSPEEIHEHKALYTPARLKRFLGSGGFPADRIRTGYFEFLLNLWAVAEKK